MLRRLEPTPPDLQGSVAAVLDRRLLPGSKRPIIVAFSGGGDSLALLLTAATWARQADRQILVLTVDHRLRPQSVGWTRTCEATAARLGLPFRALAWTGDKPTTGLPAAARAARHRLLADAARAAGARVILMGHTADDVLEAGVMRDAGSTTPEPRDWSPSPVWPQGRGLFLLRPLLGARRADIRAWLQDRRETWIDDPANDDLRYARPRARQALAGGGAAAPTGPETGAAALALACRVDRSGGFSLDRAAFRDAPPPARRRFLSAACVCAAGTGRPPPAARVEALAARLAGADAVTATLAGARIQADGHTLHIVREPGEAARGGLAPLSLAAGETGVWDGRFQVSAGGTVSVQALRGRQASLSPADRKALFGLIPAARAAMPFTTGDAEVRGLTHDRLLAACGAIVREPA